MDSRRRVRVVLIDSGVDIKINSLYQNVKQQIRLCPNDKEIIRLDDGQPTNNHGTAIAATIKHICSNIDIYSISILDRNLNSNGETLLLALRESLKFNPDIVHLSLGTNRFKYWFSLRKNINILSRNNVIVVAAVANDNKITFPAYLKNVIGVKGNRFNAYKSFYYKSHFYYAPLYIPPDLLKYDSSFKNMQGNSISAAYITGHISAIISDLQIKNSKDIRGRLKNIAENNYLSNLK
jgi:subtilisin family serine protease